MTKYEYYEYDVFVSAAYFWVNSAGCSSEFHVFKHFENLENLFLKILKEKLYIPWLVGSFSWKPCRVFKIAQCKQSRLVKPCLNSYLYLILNSDQTPFPDFPRKTEKPFLQHFWTRQQYNSLNLYIFLNFEL